jgi:CDP-6-deoxy-D-xylo-4-hexulose-3-dehydrase
MTKVVSQEPAAIMSKDQIRAEIRQLVEKYHAQAFSPQPFIPGETPVRYAGRVFDAEEIGLAVEACLDFWLTAGRFTEQFEGALAERMGRDTALLVNSGSSANLVALSALTSPQLKERRVRPGDEVITVAAGFPTTVNPIIQNRALPVFVDVELGTYIPSVEAVAAAITPKTRAVMIAHTMGIPYDATALRALCRKHDLWLVEDCCDALGATLHGQPVGAFGDLATLSFYPAHQITMGEGGAVIVEDELLARIARSFRDWGRDCYCSGGENNTCGKRFSQQFGTLPWGYDHKYVYSHVGYNLKVTDIQAAIGCAQLKKVDGFIAARRKNWATLRRILACCEDRLLLPETPPGSEPSYFGFVITVRPDAGFRRSELVNFLEAAKIETRNLFCGNLVRHPAYEEVAYRIAGDLRNTDVIMDDTFFIGVYPGLGDEQLDYIGGVFREFMKGR